MKDIYRTLVLVAAFCALTSEASAIGHTVSISTIQALCFGQCNGSATATVSGGVGPFSYSWAPSGGVAATATGLCAGPYTVTVTDQSDMSTATQTCVIVQPQQLTVGFSSIIPPTCNMCNGQISATGGGGTAPYTYMWTPVMNSSATLTNACAGTYTVTLTDSNGCNATAATTLTNQGGLTINSITASPSSYCGAQSTTLTPVFSGGTGPFTFNWTNPGNSLNSSTVYAPVASPTVTTTYTCTITDANGCVGSGTVTVLVNPAVTATLSHVDPTCNQSNGSLTVNVTQAAAPYTIAWSNGPTSTVNPNLPGGAYSVTVTDNNGCSLTLSQGLNNIGGPTVTTSAVNTGCTNSSNGSASVTASGVAPFTYLWNTSPPQTNDTATGLPAGSYMVTVTDAVGCVTVGSAQVNAMSGNLYLFATSNAPANCMQSTGIAYSYVQGGTAPYTYAWSSGGTAPIDSNLAAGTYTLTVTDVNGCSQSGSVNIQATCVNYITGRVYIDMNQDGAYNSGDYPMQGWLVQTMPYSIYTSTNSNGEYWQTTTATGSYTVSLISPTSALQLATPSSGNYPVSFAAMGDTAQNLDFRLTSPVPFQDLTLSLASGVARPGFQQMYSITCQNQGTVPVSDTIWFRHDSILTLVSATPVFDGYTHPEGYWVFNNFAPGQAISKTIWLQVPTIQNGGYLGRQLIANARIEPMATDSTSPNNGDDELDIIIGSYDPNLKECWSPTMNSNGDIWPTDLELDYTIHFQNTGTDTAFTVVVVDTLPAELDITTFRMGASSHPCTYTVSSGNGVNEVTFTFMNILLVDSTTNEPASHGYCQFTIERFPNLPIGTQIMNEANNYFDFNPAVVTNMNVVTIWDPLTVAEPANTGVVVYPNPAQDNVNILLGSDFSGTNAIVTLRDVTGREISATRTNGNITLNINTESCPAGMYFISVESAEQGTFTQQLIISAK